MDRTAVEQWTAHYELLWRTPGTELLAELFVPDASYLPSPWEQPVEGLEMIAGFWEAERKGADEEFTTVERRPGSGGSDRGRSRPCGVRRFRQTLA